MGTLSNLAATRSDVWVVCTLCSNYARFRMSELLIMCGYQTPVAKALRKFRCKNCGTKNASFWYSQPSTNLQRLERYKAK